MARVVAVLLGLRHAAGHHGQPVLLVVAADHAHGDARHPGGRGRRVRLGRRGDGLPLRQGQLRLVARHAQPDLRRRRGPVAPHRGERRRRLERPARRRAPPRHLHRDGADRGEPGPAQGRHPRGHGPLRRPLAEPRREGDRQRVLRPGDHPGHAAGRHGRQRRRRAARGRHLRGRQPAQAGVPARRPGHGGQLLPAQRRRRRAGGHVRHEGGRAGHHPARAHRLHGRVRPLPRDHGPRPGRGVEAGAGPRGHVDRRRRPRRDQRGLRGAGPALGPRPGHRRGASSTSTAGPSRSATRSA